jgi:hypothetical protein
VRDIQNVMATPTSTEGFLHVSTSLGMSMSDPVVHTFVRHGVGRTLIATIVEWERGESRYASCILRMLKPDGTLVDIDEIGFADAPPRPGATRIGTLINRPDGQDRRTSLLAYCRRNG